MPARIPDAARDGAIDSWLCGDPRRVTALKNGISEAAVSNIVREFMSLIGPERANQYRALALTMLKAGLTVHQCAQGHRLIMIMRRMGVLNGENHERFLIEISERYVKTGREPGYLFENINELHSFLDRNGGRYGTTSVSEIEDLIESKKEEQRKLNQEISALHAQEKDLERSVMNLQQERGLVESELQWDEELVRTLKTKGLQYQTVPRFVSALLLLRESGYDVFEIAEKFSRFVDMETTCIDLERTANLARLEHGKLLREIKELKEEHAMRSQSLKELKELEGIGFGLPQFKQLRYLLAEIAAQDGLSADDAVMKFFQDIQEHLYDYVWLGKRVAQLKAERNKFSMQDYTAAMNQLFQGMSKST